MKTFLLTTFLVSIAAAGASHAHGSHGGSVAQATCHAMAVKANMEITAKTFKALPQSTRMNLQHKLRHAGLYNGKDDGVWGQKTACALSQIVARQPAAMSASDTEALFEYLLDGGLERDFGTSVNPYPHPGVLY